MALDRERRRDCFYFIAVGYYRLGEYGQAREYVEHLLKKEPNNQQAKRLLLNIEEKVKRDGLVGMAVVGGAVAAGVGLLTLLSKLRKR